MSDTNLVDALQALLRFLFHTYIGVRLLGLAAVIAVVVFIAKQSFQIAKFLGGTLLAGGIITVFGGAWGFLTSANFGYIGYTLLGFVAVMAGRGILDSYGTAPLQAAPPQQPMPTPQPLSPFSSVGNMSGNAINERFGGAQQRPKFDHQGSYD